MQAGPFVISFAVPWLAACSDWSNPFDAECTEIGCLNFVRVELVFASDLAQNDVEVVVEHSGLSFSCVFGAEADPCHQGFAPDFDPGTPTNEDHLVVLLDNTPEQLRITATSSGGTETQTIEPQYERSQPNGPDCEPICLAANTTAQFSL